MDSYLTLKLKSGANKTLNFFDSLNKYVNISTYHIITYSVILNAFAVLTLLNGEFTLFLLLFATAFFLQIVAKMSKRKKNDLTRITRIYGRMSVWIMLVTVFYAIVYIYRDLITLPIISVFIAILVLCNLNYSLKILNKIEKNQFDDNGDLNSMVLKNWTKLFKLIANEKRNKIISVSRWFDEPMVVMYFILIIIYIHNLALKSNFIK
tara:strand:+ start:833 stop:1456 length:624 start_codon:yes stop_codon:yes gene_type:complete